MKLVRHLIGITLATSLLHGCSGEDGTALTHPSLKGTFPIYVTVPGLTPNSGKIFKIPEPDELGATSTPEEVLSDLNYPHALTITDDGRILYTEAPPSSTGRLMETDTDGNTPKEVIAGLETPTGVAVDSAGQTFIVEKGNGTLSRLDGDEKVAIYEELAGPTTLTRDSSDVFYITEAGNNSVATVLGNGEYQSATSEDSNVTGYGSGLVGNSFLLTKGSQLASGKVSKLTEEGGQETYLDGLIQPTSMVWEDGTVLFVAEGAPVYRIIQVSPVTNVKVTIASFDSAIATMAMTPLE